MGCKGKGNNKTKHEYGEAKPNRILFLAFLTFILLKLLAS